MRKRRAELSPRIGSYPKNTINICKRLKPLLPCELIGYEKVNVQEPVVFICNHMEIIGTIYAMLYIPFFLRPWVHDNMLHEDTFEEQVRSGVDTVFHWVPSRLRNWIVKKIRHWVVNVLNSIDPIPVRMNSMRETVLTLRETVDAMCAGENILIFPENPKLEGEDAKYPRYGIAPFSTGFAAIGGDYFKQTGKSVRFYPIYIDLRKKRMTFGDPVVFHPENGKTEEKNRIAKDLHEAMMAMAKLSL